MQWHKRKVLSMAVGLVAVATIAGACSSSGGGKSSSPTSSPAGGSGSTSLRGPGYTVRTSPSGTRATGGTVYFAEAAQAAPNYIFPMTSAQVCGVNNVEQLSAILYRPLYWYGDDYTPTVDFNRSVGQQPAWSNGDKTVTVHLNSFKWSDGEQVTSRDVEFYVNLYKASPATNYCGYVPGFFPQNVVSMSTPNTSTIVFHLNRAYNPTWFLYNELSQITPIPLAWDCTSLARCGTTTDNGHLPDSTTAGAEAVYKFLDAQSKNVNTWATSKLWSIVDGPFKLTSFTNTGQVTMVPNPKYSGTPKPSISKLVLVPFTGDSAIFNELRSAGTSALTISGLPSEYATQASAVTSEGFTWNKASSYSFNYFVLNQNNPTMGPIFRQTYFRQALQHLVDQQGWINAFLHNTAVPTYSPVPANPASPLVTFNASVNPFAFSVSDAKQLLTQHGWNVVPGGASTCKDAGTGANQCGAGVKAGQAISFNIDYQSGIPAVASEMNDLQSQARQVGIKINLTNHPFDTVISTATQCKPGQPTCNWTAENWGAGWIYAPDFLPTGESLFLTGAAANYSNFSDPQADSLIKATIYGSNEQQALTAYAKYMEQALPVVYGPTSIGTFASGAGTVVSNKLGGYAANAFGYMTPEDWYFVK